jgi:xanthine/uracil/vitamin C permease (AzgA family)
MILSILCIPVQCRNARSGATVERYFELAKHGTTARREMVAGLSYLVLKSMTGRAREIAWPMWLFGALLLL